jgi:hypothetical protein
LKSLIQIIREADRKKLADDAEDALAQIRAAIDAHGGTGTITIKLKVKKKGDAFIFGSELKVDIPQPPRVESLFFFDEGENEFTRKDPRQPEMSVVHEADFKNPRRHPQE